MKMCDHVRVRVKTCGGVSVLGFCLVVFVSMCEHVRACVIIGFAWLYWVVLGLCLFVPGFCLVGLGCSWLYVVFAWLSSVVA